MTIQKMDFESRRSVVMGRRGMVAASQPLAAAAGLEVLAGGGNAADAAVAVAAALNVTEPCSTGLGGDAFFLFYEAASKKVFALNGSGHAPAALTLEKVLKDGISGKLPAYHPYTVTVPGACAAWCDILERFGRLQRSQVLAPAIRLAEEGFPVAPLTSHFWSSAAERGQLKTALNGRELTIGGRGPRPGEIFYNPGLGKTLKRIAEGGKKAYYEGPIAEAIVEILKEAGGCMSLADLARHESTWTEPISVEYRGVRIWECPPNGQGLAALIALNLMKGFDLQDKPALSVERLHLEIEAIRLAFADARYYITDPDFAPAPLEALLSDAYAAERRKLINPARANLDLQHGTPAGYQRYGIFQCGGWGWQRLFGG